MLSARDVTTESITRIAHVSNAKILQDIRDTEKEIEERQSFVYFLKAILTVRAEEASDGIETDNENI